MKLRLVSVAVILMLATLVLQQQWNVALADSVRAFSSLSAHERAHLPESTKVTLGKVVTTLGTLRAEHMRLHAHFAGASSLGKRAGSALNSERFVVVRGLHVTGLSNVAIIASLSTPLIEPASGYAAGGLDMQAFCNAAQATICLYYPASTTLCQCGGWASFTDGYVTNASVCADENGVMLVSGCQYNYPTYYTVQFYPGAGSGPGGLAPFAYKWHCDPRFWKVTEIDPHGVVAVNTTVPEGQNFTTGSSASTCLVRVWLSP
jgi:hypothetical protein